MSGLSIQKLRKDFKDVFSGAPAPLIVRSPGRINLIGEHTDYNGGFVLPAAIDKAVFVAVSPRLDDRICLYASSYHERHDVTLASIERTAKHWPNYILGIVDQLKQRGYHPGGFNLLVDGDVPLGAGLSSSAAIECAVVFALNELFGLRLSRLDMVRIAQTAEHAFAGVRCGIMDQFASMFGRKDHLIRLDCRSVEYEYQPFDLTGYEVLLINSNVKHTLSSSAYNERRQQCEEGVAWVSGHVPQVASLRDVSVAMLEEHVLPKDKLIFNRCKYVVEEIERLLKVCKYLQAGDIEAVGKQMFRTHEGLSKEYEVSCAELDFLVNAVRKKDTVVGARLMGGGFGGCTINIVREDAVAEVMDELRPAYRDAFGKELDHYVARVENGTSLAVELQKSVTVA